MPPEPGGAAEHVSLQCAAGAVPDPAERARPALGEGRRLEKGSTHGGIEAVLSVCLGQALHIFPDYRDDTFQLARYWARMESPEVATKMWQEMAGRYGSTCPVWLAWVDFELHHGGPASVKAARAIFQKAHSKCSEIAAKWRAFEESGSAESAAQAYRKTSLINFSLMAAEAPRQVEAEVPKPTKRKKPATKKPAKKPAKKRAKVDAAAAAEVLPEKGDSEVCTLFVKNLPFDMEQQSLTDLLGGEEAVKECRIVMGWGGKSKGFAYVDCTSEAALQKALEKTARRSAGGSFLLRGRSRRARSRLLSAAHRTHRGCWCRAT